jgi:DNA-binding beta-propeller fold protein YncE
MVLGRRPEPVQGAVETPTREQTPPAERYLFGRPTDVAWDAQGNIFISDGYINHRVVKYDKNGRFIRQVGSEIRGSGIDQFNTPHTIATDAQGNVYVGDRGNGRIKVFDNNLVLRAVYDNVGSPWEICISPGPHQYLFSSNSNPDSNPAASWAITGEIYKMELDGTIIGKFGEAGKALGQFQTVHGIDCRNPDELVVTEIAAWRVQKIILRPQPRSVSAR